MYRIIDTRGSGKTSRLMLIAKENNAAFVCKNPYAMEQKALAYGILGIEFISYETALEKWNEVSGKIVIDEVEDFLSFVFPNRVIGYSLTNED